MTIPVVLVGAGGMGRNWLDTIVAHAEAELAAVVDLNVETARRALAEAGLHEVPVGTDAVQTAQQVGAEAIVNVTVPQAHHPVTTAALFAGYPVLGEKPVAESVSRALSLVAASEVTEQRFMVSQSRRYNDQVFAFWEQARTLGDLAVLTTEFFKAPHFGGFREVMDHPLLLDMAIHAFDSARFVLGAEPVAVYCEEHNPSWSWYNGNAATSAIFEMTGQARYVYSGSWCSPGLETSWNGQWRLSGEYGSAYWDGESMPVMERDPAVPPAAHADPGEGINGALTSFLQTLYQPHPPMGEVHENVMSLVMVEAAIESAERGARVWVDEVLERAHQQAIAEETHPQVREQLKSWTDLRKVLGQAGRTSPILH